MKKAFTVIILAIFLCTSGCASSQYGTQQTQVNYYPGCYQPIADLRSRENDVNRNTAGGALLGAFTGAMIGLLASGGKWQGAVIGGATGGVAGTMVGNMYGRKQQEKNDNIRLASYLQDMDGDISNMNVTTAAARTSLRCYDNAFNALIAQMKARQISREAAAQRFAEISSGREEAINILGNTVEYGQNLTQEYEQALMSEEQQLNVSASTANNPAAYVEKKRTINTARKKNSTLNQKVAATQQVKQQAQSDSSAQMKQINEMYAQLDEARR